MFVKINIFYVYQHVINIEILYITIIHINKKLIIIQENNKSMKKYFKPQKKELIFN
jgi:hypothetical protein